MNKEHIEKVIRNNRAGYAASETDQIAAEAAGNIAEWVRKMILATFPNVTSFDTDCLTKEATHHIQAAIEKATEETVAYWQGVATQEWHKGWAACAEAHKENNKSRAAHANEPTPEQMRQIHEAASEARRRVSKMSRSERKKLEDAVRERYDATRNRIRKQLKPALDAIKDSVQQAHASEPKCGAYKELDGTGCVLPVDHEGNHQAS